MKTYRLPFKIWMGTSTEIWRSKGPNTPSMTVFWMKSRKSKQRWRLLRNRQTRKKTEFPQSYWNHRITDGREARRPLSVLSPSWPMLSSWTSLSRLRLVGGSTSCRLMTCPWTLSVCRQSKIRCRRSKLGWSWSSMPPRTQPISTVQRVWLYRPSPKPTVS